MKHLNNLLQKGGILIHVLDFSQPPQKTVLCSLNIK